MNIPTNIDIGGGGGGAGGLGSGGGGINLDFLKNIDWSKLKGDGTWLGAAISAISSLGQYKLGKRTADIEEENLARQVEAFSKSHQLAREQYQYSKSLQDTVFQREDDSIRRRVADLRAAGLSPVLAAGQGARAGAVVPTRPPTKQPGIRGVEGMKLMMASLGTASEIAKTVAETSSILAQARRHRGEESRASELHTLEFERMINENKVFRDTMYFEIDRIIAGSVTQSYMRDIAMYNRNIANIDEHFKQAFRNYLVHRYPGQKPGSFQNLYSPYTVDYLLAQVQARMASTNADIKDIELKWAERAKWMKVGGEGVDLIGMIIRAFMGMR